MTKYVATVRLAYFVNVEVEADNLDQAHDLAVRQAWRGYDKGEGSWGEEPTVYDLTEGEHE